MEYTIHRKTPGSETRDSDKLNDPSKRPAVASCGTVSHSARRLGRSEEQVQAMRPRHGPKKSQQHGSSGLVGDFAESTRAALPPTAGGRARDIGRGTGRREGELTTRDTPS